MKYYLGLDPGFAFLGLAGVAKTSRGGLSVLWLDVLETRKETGQLLSVDNVRRLTLIADRLALAMDRPGAPWDGVIAEAMSHVRNASASTKVGMTWGALVANCHARDLPLTTISPQRIRKHLVGVKDVPKAAVQMELEKRFGDMSHHLEHLNKGKRNHAYDALAAAVAILEKD